MLLLAADNARAFAQKITSAFRDLMRSQRKEMMYVSGLLLVLIVLFWRLWDTRFLPEKSDGQVFTGGSCWADLPIHLHLANTFLLGRNQDVSFKEMHSPIFAGKQMSYPFLPDFHAAIMVRLGSEMRWSMLIPGFLLFLSLMGLVYRLNTRLMGHRMAALASVVLILFAGGVGGINMWRIMDWERLMSKDPIQDDAPPRGDSSVFWFGFLTHVLMPQRGATFAYPVCLVVILLVLQATRSTRDLTLADRRRLIVLAGFLASLLPLVHVRTTI